MSSHAPFAVAVTLTFAMLIGIPSPHPAEAAPTDYPTWTASDTISGMASVETSGPDDPDYRSGNQWALQKVHAIDAWGYSAGHDVVIAVIDSGIDPNHPDLQGRLMPGYNVFDQNDDTSDGCGHGTHVAGIAAATANNGLGIAGIAPDAKLMPVKVIDDSCNGSYNRIVSGMQWALDHGARILLIASGGSVYSPRLHDAVRDARSRGALVIAAAGNSNSDGAFYPAAHPEAFAVSGTTSSDRRYRPSNYGANIDVAAPAYSIYSTYVKDGESTYTYLSGTSTAAPHVAAIAALIWANYPDYSVSQVEEIIRSSADDLGDSGWDKYFGAGRVNALNALLWAAAPRTAPAGGALANAQAVHHQTPY